MKRISLSILFLISAYLYASEAKVKFLINDVKYKVNLQQQQWAPLKINDLVPEKSVVRCGKDSRCELLLPDGSVTKILANSMIQIKSVQTKDNPNTSIFTLLGKFFFKVKKGVLGEFEVKSPNSVIAVRGTEFLVTNGSKKSEVWVLSGIINFSDKNMITYVTINPGQKSSVKSEGFPTKPKPLNSREKQILADLAGTKSIQPKPKSKTDNKLGMTQKSDSKPGVTPPQPPTTQSTGTPSDQDYTPTEDDQKEESKEDKTGKEGMVMGVAVGAATIDNQIYNQIGLRPEFSAGKFGIALDLTIYIDDKGKIRKDNWDSADDIIEKIYYIRYGRKGDPFYAKVGAIDNYRLGYGLLMNHYFNTIEYPTVIRTGLETGFQANKVSLDLMLNDFKELGRPGGLFAGRLSYKIIGNLELGASAVYDRNQFASLPDQDDDGVPDALDDFPDDKKYAKDSDNDGYPDETDKFFANDTTWDDVDPSKIKPDPFNIKSAEDREQFAFCFDIGYPIVNKSSFQLILYSQAAKFGEHGGWGFTIPGFLAKFAFINLYAEHRIFNKRFIPEYYNHTYELERATFIQDTSGALIPIAKKQKLMAINKRLQGFVAGADFNIGNLVILGAEYQNMTKGAFKFKTFRSSLDLNTQFIPKINSAGAYYCQLNVNKLFEKDEGTIFGYKFEYEIASGAFLILDYRTTYRDMNGDGKISGDNETIKTTNIQTAFKF